MKPVEVLDESSQQPVEARTPEQEATLRMIEYQKKVFDLLDEALFGKKKKETKSAT